MEGCHGQARGALALRQREYEIRAEINPQDRRDQTMWRGCLTVAEDVENEASPRCSLEEAQAGATRRPQGRRLYRANDLPPIDFGRIAAQNAKQVIVQKVRDAERERQYEEYKDRVAEIVQWSW